MEMGREKAKAPIDPLLGEMSILAEHLHQGSRSRSRPAGPHCVNRRRPCVWMHGPVCVPRRRTWHLAPRLLAPDGNWSIVLLVKHGIS